MIQAEFFIVIISSLISSTAFIAILIKSLKNPLVETKIFSFGFFLMVMLLWLYVPSSLLYSANSLDSFNFSLFGSTIFKGSLGYFFNQCSYLAGMIGFLFISYALLLPNFEPNYKSMTLISLLTALLTGIGFILFFTVKQSVINNKITTSISDPIGYIAFGLLGFISVFVLVYRIKEIQKVQKHRSSIFTSPFFLVSITFLILATVSALVIPTIISTGFPIYSFSFPLSIALALFAFAFIRDDVFLFITPISLESFVCIHKTSGLALYSISTEGDDDAESLIGSIFQALNISLTEIVQSKKGLERIRYGDKTALIITGNHIITVIFASKVNLILSAISKQMTRSFEQNYGNLLQKENTIFNQKDFENFETIYNKYNLYFS